MGRDVGGDGLTADFFFAFDQKLDVDGQAAAAGSKRLNGLDVGIELTLVIGRSTGEEAAVPYGGLKGRRHPLIEGIRWLHVVVAVAEDGWFAGGFEALGVDQRVPFTGDDFHRFHVNITKA